MYLIESMILENVETVLKWNWFLKPNRIYHSA